MHCSACGASTAGSGRCAGCGASVPIPGEELAVAHPVALAVPMDRRGERDGSARPPPPAPLREAVALDRRELPREPAHRVAPPEVEHAPATPALLLPELEPEPAPAVPQAKAARPLTFEIDLDADDDIFVEDPARKTATVLRLLVSWGVDGVVLLGLPLGTLHLATRGLGGGSLPALAAAHLSVLVAGVSLVAITGFVYLTLSCALGGRTLGDRLAGLRAVVRRSGEPPTLGRAALRAAAAVVGGAAFLAGPLWALFDSKGQGLHDKIAGTVLMVVER